MSRYQRLGIGISLLGILANGLTLTLSPTTVRVPLLTASAFFQGLAVIGYLLVAKRGMLSLIFIWLGIGTMILSEALAFGVSTAPIFLILLVFALVAATGTAVQLSMRRYQSLGKIISLLIILTNILLLSLGPDLMWVIIFTTGALIQLLAFIGYLLVTKRSLPGLIFIWLGAWALALSGLYLFFIAYGMIFLILLVFALAAAIGVTVHLPTSDVKKMAIIVSGVSGVFLITYLVLIGYFR